MKTPLNYKGFEEYLKYYCNDFFGGNTPHGENPNEQFCYRFTFPNGYSVSVIKHCGSYGYQQDLFEIATMDDCEDFTNIVGITDEDAIKGWLTNEEVLEILEMVKAL